MKILLFHNYYRLPGGEDYVVDAEKALLESHGHEVLLYTVKNETMMGFGFIRKLTCTLWNKYVYNELLTYLNEHRPDVMHLHNDFPFASPAVVHAAKAASVPVVQTLHNYRQMCVNGLLSLKGSPCELCVGKRFGWAGVKNKCYRGGYLSSLAVVLRNFLHHRLGTWRDLVDGFIAPTVFVKQKYIASGIDDCKIVVKPHFMPEPDSNVYQQGQYALVLGRFTVEKGVDRILEAFENNKMLGPIKFVGAGPLEGAIVKAAKDDARISIQGWADGEALNQLFVNASYVVCGATVYETFGRVIMEAFTYGKPVVCSRGGAFEELVDDRETGYLFDARSVESLIAAMLDAEKVLADDGQKIARRCYREYQEKYAAEQNYKALIEIYHNVSEGRLVGATPITIDGCAA